MKLSELKNALIDKSFSLDKPLILVCPDNFFLADQYIQAMADAIGAEIEYIGSLDELRSASSLVVDRSSTLSVLKADEFADPLDDIDSLGQVVIACRKLNKGVADKLRECSVDVPKLEDWQILAYIEAVCPALSQSDAALLYKATKGDIYKIDSELSKICLFDKPSQKSVYQRLMFDDGSDLYSIDTYELCDKIVRNDKRGVYDALLRRGCLSLDPLAMVGMLLSSFKCILFVHHNSGVKSWSEVNMKDGQAYIYKKNYKGFPLDYVMRAIERLSGIDLKLKSGLLDMPKDKLLDYVVCGVMR